MTSKGRAFIHEAENAIDTLARTMPVARSVGGVVWVDDEEAQRGLTEVLGTSTSSSWICDAVVELPLRAFPAAVSPDSDVALGIRWIEPPLSGRRSPHVFRTRADVVFDGVSNVLIEVDLPAPWSVAFTEAAERYAGEHVDATTLRTTQSAALEVRSLSGLSASAVAELFPVSRETFQRWLSGQTDPSDANLRRLLLLKRLFSEVARVVGDVRAWLLEPIDVVDFATPLDWLREGRLTEVIDWLSRQSPRAISRHAALDRSSVVRLATPSRAPRHPTSSDDIDDLADWPDE